MLGLGKLEALLRIMRPVNCLMMGFAVIVGGVIARSSVLGASATNLVYGFITAYTLTAGSMAVNDYYDREIDATNEPNRPIPSGLVKPKDALIFAAVLALVGFAASYATGFISLAVALISWMLFTSYTTVGKRSGLPGNFLVSICVANAVRLRKHCTYRHSRHERSFFRINGLSFKHWARDNQGDR